MAGKQTKAAPEELEQNQEQEENQEPETKQEEDQPINPHTGRPVNPAGNPVNAVTDDSWWRPKKEEQYHEHSIGSWD